MRVEWQPALVLHKRAYRETSLQLDLLTRDHGIVALVAKGVTGAKNHILRAQLQPLQHIKVSFLLKGELGTLVQSEPLPPPLAFAGERLMAGLYLNELVLKLCPRHDADNELYQRLLQARVEQGVIQCRGGRRRDRCSRRNRPRGSRCRRVGYGIRTRPRRRDRRPAGRS